jgi:hypothetical protein
MRISGGRYPATSDAIGRYRRDGTGMMAPHTSEMTNASRSDRSRRR